MSVASADARTPPEALWVILPSAGHEPVRVEVLERYSRLRPGGRPWWRGMSARWRRV
jgi:hypothetical protein